MANALPVKVIDNDELISRFPVTDIAAFLKMTGISERHILAPGQAASDLACLAAENLLTETGYTREKIDTLIYCSLTADYQTPATASILQHRLNLSTKTCTFDVVQACPAFIHTLGIVKGMFSGTVSKSILLILADALSQTINPRDRGLVPIHGDGATVLLLDQVEQNESLVEWTEFGTDGSQWERIYIPDGKGRSPFNVDSLKEEKDEQGNYRSAVNLKMDGAAVFHFAIHTIPKFLKESCQEHNCSLDDYDLILFHQANKIIVDMLYNMMKIPMEKRFYFMDKVGNLSGVSLPFMLAEACRAGKVQPNSRILLCGFGAGMSWGAASLHWQNENPFVPGCSWLP